ncbi:MAG TPA: DnaD domain protein [Anaerolineales bacterium]|nr:DnaD domain protein [Anaerolineales bacterium]
MPFSGFESNRGATAVPSAFFHDLLPAIDHLGELKISLYALHRLERQEAPQPYLDPEAVLGDADFTAGFGETPAERKAAIADSLERAVARGILLRGVFRGGEEEQMLYLLNSPRGRAALRGLEEGRWGPDDEEIPEPLPERPNIFQLYEKNIGPLTPLLADTLREAEAEYPPEWIEDALAIALSNNVRKWRYVEAILHSWREKGRNDREDRQAAETSGRKYIEGEFSEFIER